MFTPIALGLFGLIVGSFLNVLVRRHGVRPVTGRSTCESCGRTIAWYDLAPVLSWVHLRGRCRSCGEHISIQYILVEACTAILFALIGLAPLPLHVLLLALPIAALLVAIAVHDLRAMLIPDAWVYVFAALSLVVSFISVDTRDMYHNVPLALLSGPATAAPLFGLWYFSGGRWMGFGDVKLALGMGWLLGFTGGFAALFLAFILGAAASIPLLFFSSSLWERMRSSITPRGVSQVPSLTYTIKSEVPFGPFLIAGCLFVWLTQMYDIALVNSLILEVLR